MTFRDVDDIRNILLSRNADVVEQRLRLESDLRIGTIALLEMKPTPFGNTSPHLVVSFFEGDGEGGPSKKAQGEYGRGAAPSQFVPIRRCR